MDQVYLPYEIFVTGLMGSGKDTLADAMVEGAGYTKLAFAAGVYEETADEFGVTVELIRANKAFFRPHLQRVGHARREQDPNYWLNDWTLRRANINGPVVVTDCRYLNEATFGLQRGALVLRVVADEETRLARIEARDGQVPTQETMNHPSEVDVPNLPVHLELPGTLPKESILPTIASAYRVLAGMNNDSVSFEAEFSQEAGE